MLGRLALAAFGLGTALATNTAAAQDMALREKPARVGHIAVLFEESGGFDNAFGLFPGANNPACFAGLAPRIAGTACASEGRRGF